MWLSLPSDGACRPGNWQGCGANREASRAMGQAEAHGAVCGLPHKAAFISSFSSASGGDGARPVAKPEVVVKLEPRNPGSTHRGMAQAIISDNLNLLQPHLLCKHRTDPAEAPRTPGFPGNKRHCSWKRPQDDAMDPVAFRDQTEPARHSFLTCMEAKPAGPPTLLHAGITLSLFSSHASEPATQLILTTICAQCPLCAGQQGGMRVPAPGCTMELHIMVNVSDELSKKHQIRRARSGIWISGSRLRAVPQPQVCSSTGSPGKASYGAGYSVGSPGDPHCPVVTPGMAGVSPFLFQPSDDSDTWMGTSPGGKTGEEHALPIAKQPEN